MALILALFLSRFYTPRELTVDEYKALGAYLIDPPRQLAEFNLVDDKGEIFLPEQFNNKWNILFFGFTYCPDICPLTMKQMSDVKEMLGEDAQKIRVFLVSVDPDRDKPENLRVYLDNFSNNFRGLTGEIDQIYKFSTQVNAPFFPVVNNPEPNYTVDHSGSLVIIDPDAKYAGFFRAPHDTSKITKALASILN
tara:strand:+ start:114 stop:695 length:582 start_codon:yes stop_codon:yes gene_type:complete